MTHHIAPHDPVVTYLLDWLLITQIPNETKSKRQTILSKSKSKTQNKTKNKQKQTLIWGNKYIEAPNRQSYRPTAKSVDERISDNISQTT